MNLLFAGLYSISSLTQNFYFADFLDVIIVTLLIYSVILLFKQTRSLLALIGIGMLVALYITAQMFNFYLTSLALQSFFAAFIVVLVVIFQDELRRFFEIIAVWSTRQNIIQPIASRSAAMNELIQAVARLSHTKTGAIIVLSGQENIERHTDGGKILDGVISEELLLSIFDATSPGHDGAMIINKNRIVQFGAHLPLSNNFKEIGKRGTRHSAALGIAECSDAFTVVISEEQGTISVAHEGKLKQIKNIEELNILLSSFLKEKFPEVSYSIIENIFRKNSIEKLIALMVAIVLWFIISFPTGTIQRDFTIPISYHNLPENFVIEESNPKEILITLAGRGENAFGKIQIEKLEAAIEGNVLRAGANKIRIDENLIARPINLSVVKINSSDVQIFIKKYNKANVPIKIRTSGTIARGYVINSIESIPKYVTLMIQEGQSAPANILTETADITNISEDTPIKTKLILPYGARFSQESDGSVLITVDVRKK
ncbi:MAG: diadenylate cyclase [Patescibacteria group bacterium]